MNWFLVGGGALIVFWLAGRRVAKRDAATPEPIFASGDRAGSAGAGGAAYYGGGGGGDGGFSLVSPELAPIGSDIRPSGLREDFLQGTFVNAIGRGNETMTVLPMDELPVTGAHIPKSATIEAATSNSTELGSSSKSMSQFVSTANNDRAVSAAVQAQPPRSFSSVSAAISEKNMSPLMLEKTVAPVAIKPVSLPGELSRSMTLGQSFVSSIRPASISLRPISLTSAVRR